MSGWWTEELLPTDFTQRLSRAFAAHVWKYIDGGAGLAAYSEREPLAVLSHNLDFWLPYAITVTEGVMGTFERVEPETDKQKQQLERDRKEDFEEAWIERPRKAICSDPLPNTSQWRDIMRSCFGARLLSAMQPFV